MPGSPGPDARGGVSQGTGFIISADGYVLTNHHVVDGADDSRACAWRDRREFNAKVVGSDPQSDVALLKIDGKRPADAAHRRFAQRSSPASGWSRSVRRSASTTRSPPASSARVGRASLDADQQYVPFIQTDVAINRGNSGGPLLNTRGEVVGINSQIFCNSGGYMGVSFAIPIDVAMNAVQQLKATGKVTRGQLGVQHPGDAPRRGQGRLGLADASRRAGRRRGRARQRRGACRHPPPGRDPRLQRPARSAESSDLPPMVGAMAPGTRVTIDADPRRQAARPGDRHPESALRRRVAAGQPATDGAPRPAAAAQANPLGIVGRGRSTRSSAANWACSRARACWSRASKAWPRAKPACARAT